jgi:hypothetical protein
MVALFHRLDYSILNILLKASNLDSTGMTHISSAHNLLLCAMRTHNLDGVLTL